MGHEFEVRKELDLAASPEDVWAAIATGPGLDAWLMGRSEVEPDEGGAVRTTFGDYTSSSTITAWAPGQRFAHRSDVAEDGRVIAYEFLIEGHGGSTVLRTVASGFIPGDDWEDEYEAMTMGMELFFATLSEYLAHFAGRTATPITVFGPVATDWERTRAALNRALGLLGTPVEGQSVRFELNDRGSVEGVVYFVDPHSLAVRTSDALYRFLRGFQGPMVLGHHLFSEDVDQEQTERAWQAWLSGLFA